MPPEIRNWKKVRWFRGYFGSSAELHQQKLYRIQWKPNN